MKELNEIIREMDGLKMSEEQKCYAIAKAWYETLNETAAEIEKKILQEHEFYSVCPECPELDGKRAEYACEFVKNEGKFNEYMKLFYAECDRQGIAWEWNKTIEGDAYYTMKEAENALLDWFEKSISKFGQIKQLRKLHPDSIAMMRKHWNYRGQLIEMA